MRLLLTVLSAQRNGDGVGTTREFDIQGGTIGRSASCDWTLADPANTLSARHATISHNGLGFVITDTSTNGVYVNAVQAPLGRDNSAPLNDGDKIYLGPYVLGVVVKQAQALPPLPRPPVASMPADFSIAPTIATPMFPPIGAAPQGGAFPPVPAQPAPFPAAAAPFPGSPPPLAQQPLPAAGFPPSALRPAAQGPGLIPDDFNFSDLLSPSFDARPAQGAQPQLAQPAPVFAPPPPMPPMPAAPVPPPPPPPPADPLDPVALLRQRAASRAASINLRPTNEPAAPLPPPIANGGRAAEGPGEQSPDLLWQALGIDPSKLPPQAREEMIQQIGRAMRETANGLVAILRARKSIKDEFQVEQTRLDALENNPFKFFRTGDDALRRVVGEAAPGFLPLDRAVAQGFDDIKTHETVIVATLQKAIATILSKLSPQGIEANAEPGLLGRRPDKSKLWDRYAEVHAALAGNLDRTTRQILGEEFGRAYAQPSQPGSRDRA